jgi:hypothetical protein
MSRESDGVSQLRPHFGWWQLLSGVFKHHPGCSSTLALPEQHATTNALPVSVALAEMRVGVLVDGSDYGSRTSPETRFHSP